MRQKEVPNDLNIDMRSQLQGSRKMFSCAWSFDSEFYCTHLIFGEAKGKCAMYDAKGTTESSESSCFVLDSAGKKIMQN